MPPYRIMTFDGGGVKGALMATLVKRISDKYPNLLNEVDLFAGTSTGSVVALTLASGFDAATLVDFYSQANLRSAFSPSRLNWFRPKFSNANFRSLLEIHFPGNPRLGDLTTHNLVAPTFKLDNKKKQDWCPVFAHNFPGSHPSMSWSSTWHCAALRRRRSFPRTRDTLMGAWWRIIQATWRSQWLSVTEFRDLHLRISASYLSERD